MRSRCRASSSLFPSSTSQGFYREAGVFTADGNGSITAGTEDFNSAGVFGAVSSTPITGKYSIAKDGTGVIQLNVNGGTETWAITLVSSSKFYLTEGDAFSNFAANAAGQGEKQDTSAINSVPSGTFAFRVHQTLTSSPDSAIAGEFTASSANGEADVIQKVGSWQALSRLRRPSRSWIIRGAAHSL